MSNKKKISDVKEWFTSIEETINVLNKRFRLEKEFEYYIKDYEDTTHVKFQEGKIIEDNRNKNKPTDIASSATKIKSKTRYNHDCPTCKFIGAFEGYDAYHCDKHGILLRYGNTKKVELSVENVKVFAKQRIGTLKPFELAAYQTALKCGVIK